MGFGTWISLTGDLRPQPKLLPQRNSEKELILYHHGKTRHRKEKHGQRSNGCQASSKSLRDTLRNHPASDPTSLPSRWCEAHLRADLCWSLHRAQGFMAKITKDATPNASTRREEPSPPCPTECRPLEEASGKKKEEQRSPEYNMW